MEPPTLVIPPPRIDEEVEPVGAFRPLHDGTTHEFKGRALPVEASGGKPRKLIVCIDGTSNQFSDKVGEYL